jgi:hypothetical protein
VSRFTLAMFLTEAASGCHVPGIGPEWGEKAVAAHLADSF